MAHSFNEYPMFRELPTKKGAPEGSSWGVFGDDDELGCLNFLRPEGVIEAARLVQRGAVFRLDTPIGYARPPLFGRDPVRHTVVSWRDRGFFAYDDQLDAYNTQEGAQWDGLGHVGHPEHQFYNGVTAEQIEDKEKLGVHRWADKLVGRGVLVDLAAYRAQHGAPVDPGSQEAYTVADLEGAVAEQSGNLESGSILLLRTGWMKHYLESSDDQRAAMGPVSGLTACGVEAATEVVAWFWDHRVAAVGTDCPAVEPFPWDPNDPDALHCRTLAMLGLPIGEQFDLEALAADSAHDRQFECLLVSAPLYLVGGIASPPNAIAIK